MDRLAVLQHAITRTENAARRYTQPGAVEVHGRDILTSSHVDGWTVGVLQRILVDIADDHAGCDEVNCRTCAAIRDGLAASLTGLQNLRREHLEAKVRSAAAAAWWRR